MAALNHTRKWLLIILFVLLALIIAFIAGQSNGRIRNLEKAIDKVSGK